MSSLPSCWMQQDLACPFQLTHQPLQVPNGRLQFWRSAGETTMSLRFAASLARKTQVHSCSFPLEHVVLYQLCASFFVLFLNGTHVLVNTLFDHSCISLHILVNQNKKKLHSFCLWFAMLRSHMQMVFYCSLSLFAFCLCWRIPERASPGHRNVCWLSPGV